jgi:hypothetical protein
MKRICILTALLLVAYPCLAQDKDKPFPSDDEINLLLTQGDRAMQQYKATIELEKMQFEKMPGEAAAIAKDKEVYSGWETMLNGMKTKPKTFNSRFGLEIVLLLDDASRNMVLCSSQAALQVPSVGSVSEAQTLLHLAQSCSDTSTLIYTVSENAGALYQKYLDAEEQMTNEAAEFITKCGEILKNSTASQKH